MGLPHGAESSIPRDERTRDDFRVCGIAVLGRSPFRHARIGIDASHRLALAVAGRAIERLAQRRAPYRRGLATAAVIAAAVPQPLQL